MIVVCEIWGSEPVYVMIFVATHKPDKITSPVISVSAMIERASEMENRFAFFWICIRYEMNVFQSECFKWILPRQRRLRSRIRVDCYLECVIHQTQWSRGRNEGMPAMFTEEI